VVAQACLDLGPDERQEQWNAVGDQLDVAAAGGEDHDPAERRIVLDAGQELAAPALIMRSTVGSPSASAQPRRP